MRYDAQNLGRAAENMPSPCPTASDWGCPPVVQLQALKQAMRSLAEERDAAAAAEAKPLRRELAEQQQHIEDLAAALDTARKVQLSFRQLQCIQPGMRAR